MSKTQTSKQTISWPTELPQALDEQIRSPKRSKLIMRLFASFRIHSMSVSIGGMHARDCSTARRAEPIASEKGKFRDKAKLLKAGVNAILTSCCSEVVPKR